MADKRRLAAVAAVALVIVGGTVAAWMLLSPDETTAADCRKVHDILDYSTAGMEQLTETALNGGDNPDAAVAEYAERARTMRDMAGQIADSELHGASQRLVDLDENIVEVWADTVAVPQQPGTDTSAATNEFTQAYRDYNTEHNDVVDGLLVTCPRDA